MCKKTPLTFHSVPTVQTKRKLEVVYTWGCFFFALNAKVFKRLHLFQCVIQCLSTLKIQNVFVQVEYSVCICASILNTGRGSVVPGSDVIIN